MGCEGVRVCVVDVRVCVVGCEGVGWGGRV